MGVLTAIADRMLSLIVPRTTAAACHCQPDTHQVFCYCSVPNPVIGKLKYYKSCSYNCSCQLICGGCNPVSGC